MSVNAVSGTSLRQDLVGALRQARAASIQPIDASGFSTASQDAGTTQATGSTPQSTSAASPALSGDLMASLLQLQSDFSQMGLQTGVTSAADSEDATSSGLKDAGQAATGSAPVHHHHGHHARAPEPDAETAQAGSSGSATEAGASASTDAAATGSSAGTDVGDGLQALFQQMTKAIAAYATGGPVGVAAAALTSSSKA